MNKDVIFIANFHPFTTRNIFDTGVLDIISSKSRKVVVFVPKEKENYMKTLYEKENIVVEGVEDNKLFTREATFFYRLGEVLIDTKTKRDHQLKYRLASKRFYRHVKYYLMLFIIRTFGKSEFIKRTSRVVEGFSHKPRGFEKYFEKYKPNIVFSTDIFAEVDTLLVLEAKQRNVETRALVRSWDNTTNKTLLRVIPDKLLVQNETMKEECESIHLVPSNRIKVVGVPQFEYYLKYNPISRKDYCELMGLKEDKKIILYSPAGSKYSQTDWQIAEILKNLQKEGNIPSDVQFLIRLHPQNYTDLSQFKANENFVIDDPGVGLKVDRAKEFELGKQAVNHLADSLYHSALVLNVVSSMVVDAAIFNKPIITIGFNGWEKDVPYLKSVERVQQQEWLAVLNNTGCAPTAHNPQELATLINQYLSDPQKDSDLRKKFIKKHCYKFDGHSASRMANAVLDDE